MLNNANFLCEIGTEEIPAEYIPPALKAMKDIFRQRLTASRIDFGEIEAYATPRRLVILVSSVAESQYGEEVELKGPSVKAACDNDGNPTKALLGFMKGNNITLQDVYEKKTDKGVYIFANKKLEIKKTCEIIPNEIEFLINNMPFPKRMKWSDKKINFPRPIIYFLLLLNNEIIPFDLSGISSSNLTRGHYIQSNRMIEIKNIRDYEKTLNENAVVLDQNERMEFIRNELAGAAEALGGIFVDDEELLTRVAYLTEKPSVIACKFDRVYLEIPDIVLITEMKENQSYFALRDRDGRLMPNFLVVSNNPLTEDIRKGNERVIAARFNDAKFFFNEDRKTRLNERIESLKGILFHKDLGTIHDKMERMSFIADYISSSLGHCEKTLGKIKRAISLCKADLATAMVSEFTSLQGEIGRIYALLDGEDEETADAVRDHYRPRFQGDEAPTNVVSIVVSISEKIDNIFGSFSVGNIPKGSVDPYALRRQAAAIIELLLVNKINICLKSIFCHISQRYKNGKNLVEKILEFISGRAKTIFLENGIKYDEIDACFSIGYYDFLDLFMRARSLNEFRKDESFTQMLFSFKRMNNIISIFMNKNPGYKFQFDPLLLKEESEKELYEFFNSRQKKIEDFLNSTQYTDLFRLLIEGKMIIDKFFDCVMVMVDDMIQRNNRLALLEKILYPFRNFLDFSRISE